MKTRFVIFLILFMGCASEKPINTYARTPEITIPGVTKKQAKEALIEQMISRGFIIRSANDFSQSSSGLSIIFNKPMDDSGSQYFQDPDQDTPMEYRVKFNLFDTDSGVRIVLSYHTFTNPDYSAAVVHGFSRSDEKDYWQELFVSLANSF
jgi:hypothetical protein